MSNQERALVPLPPEATGGTPVVPSEALRRATGLALGAAGLALEVLRVLVSRRNASVQDLLVGTAVVYDWSYRHAGESPPSGDARSPSPAPGSEQA
jgi:hypothetical protein